MIEAPRSKEYEERFLASEMGRVVVEIERERDASFDPARQIKVVDEQGHIRILYKSWASEITIKTREDEEKRPKLSRSNCWHPTFSPQHSINMRLYGSLHSNY